LVKIGQKTDASHVEVGASLNVWPWLTLRIESNYFLVEVSPLAENKFSDLSIKTGRTHFISRYSRERTRNTIYRCVWGIDYGHL